MDVDPGPRLHQLPEHGRRIRRFPRTIRPQPGVELQIEGRIDTVFEPRLGAIHLHQRNGARRETVQNGQFWALAIRKSRKTLTRAEFFSSAG